MSGGRQAAGRMRMPVLVVSCALAAVLAVLALYASQEDAGMGSGAMESVNSTDSVPVFESLKGGNHTIPAEIAASNNRFAFDFYREVAGGNDQDIFFSPLGMYVAFSALYEGASEDARAQLEGAFGFEPDDARRAEFTADMMRSLNRDDPHAILEMANGIYQFVPLKEPYLAVLDDVYLVDNLASRGGDPVGTINDWAAQKTHGKIEKVIEVLPPNPVMILLNAIYFKGTWVSQFDPEDTEEGSFETAAGKEVTAKFMNLHGAWFDYAVANGVQMLRMPYEGDRLSMVLLLPGDAGGIGELGDTVSGNLLAEWTSTMHKTQLTLVTVPKFEMTTDYDLIPPLMSMGITDIFDGKNRALYEIGNFNITVSSATQDAYVMVNEEGTEAAAVTTIVTSTDDMSPSHPAFVADRPFIFIILDDDSGTILFMGKVSNPQA